MGVRPLLVAALALLAVGCRLDVVAGTEVDADGSGRVALSLTIDRAFAAELEQLDVDPTAEVAAVAVEAEHWELERHRGDGGELTLVLARDVDDPAGFGAAYRDLTRGLDAADPALDVDLEVVVDDGGAATVSGTAELRAPATPGATIDDEPVGPDARELRDLVADTVDARVSVTLPGAVREHDGDELEGRTVTWGVTTEAVTPLQARAAAPPWWEALPVWAVPAAVTGAALLLVLGVVGWWWRRRRRRAAPAAD